MFLCPQRKATISVTDRVFVRSGAADVITSNLSTFMVEMVEAANILHHATSDSLVILDEIGRGTSTYDGLSLAWAMTEYLVSREGVRPKTLFATHYHELQVLAEQYPAIHNFQILVEEHEGALRFLHTVAPGGASHSYGIAVAGLAGVPPEVLRRAVTVLKTLEEKEIATPAGALQMPSMEQMSLISDDAHPVLEALRELDVEKMSPLEALQKLAELQSQS